ncbi:MAG: hypothetical protein ACKVS8_11900 [Phycisphaerales bacterium]
MRVGRSMVGCVAAALACAGIAASGLAHAAGAVVGQPDDLAQHFRALLLDKDTRGQADLMRSLRSMRDPSLGPLFTRLATCESPVLRAHAIIALSEVPVGKGLDLMLVRSQEAALQADVLTLALDAGVIGPTQTADLARWTDLPDPIYLAIVVKLPVNDAAVDAARLEAVAAGEHTARAIGATALLDQRAGTRRLALLGDRVAALLEQNRHAELVFATGMIVGAGFDAAVPALREWSVRFASDGLAAADLASALLRLDPDQRTAGREWLERFGAAGDEGDAARLQLGALAASLERRSGLPLAVVQAVATDTRDSSALVARVLKAVADGTGDEAVAAVESALMMRSSPVMRWAEVFAEAQTTPGAWAAGGANAAQDSEAAAARARRIRAGLIRLAEGTADPELLPRAGRAATRLATGDAKDTGELARAARAALERRDERLLRVLLEAALSGGAAGCERVEGALRGVEGSLEEGLATQTRSVLTLIRARARSVHSPEQVEELARLAAGAGDLRPALRAQAAWIALRATGQDQAALALTIAGVEP